MSDLFKIQTTNWTRKQMSHRLWVVFDLSIVFFHQETEKIHGVQLKGCTAQMNAAGELVWSPPRTRGKLGGNIVTSLVTPDTSIAVRNHLARERSIMNALEKDFYQRKAKDALDRYGLPQKVDIFDNAQRQLETTEPGPAGLLESEQDAGGLEQSANNGPGGSPGTGGYKFEDVFADSGDDGEFAE